MALNKTTLSGAMLATDTTLGVASATGITAPVNPTGAGITYLFCEGELMYVTAVTGTQVNVIRGVAGTKALSHANAAPIIAGLPSDFAAFVPTQNVYAPDNSNFVPISAAVASATTITPTGRRFHVTGTTATATINLPPTLNPGGTFLEGDITVIADGVWTWTAAGNILVAGTVTTAGSCVTFIYDVATGKWYPSRLA